MVFIQGNKVQKLLASSDLMIIGSVSSGGGADGGAGVATRGAGAGEGAGAGVN